MEWVYGLVWSGCSKMKSLNNLLFHLQTFLLNRFGALAKTVWSVMPSTLPLLFFFSDLEVFR
jgi:hypothetical protein